MKTLKFKNHLAKEILEGRKVSTWRLFDDKNLLVNDQLEFFDSERGEKFAEAIITKVYEKTLGSIEDADFDGHEKFASNEEMLETYKKYYGKNVDWNTIVKIIRFKLL